jgi:hypothetical protein
VVIQRMNTTPHPPQYNVGVIPPQQGRPAQPVITPAPTYFKPRTSTEVYRIDDYSGSQRKSETIWIQNNGNGRTEIRRWER